MQIKMVEIRDRATKIPVIALKTEGDDLTEEKFFKAQGFEPYTVMLISVEGQEAHYDAYLWKNRRTMTTAHRYIEQNFDTLPNAAVVDVEYINGEKATSAPSEIWR